MTDERMYSTVEMMELLGIKSRQTIYAWRLRPDRKDPGHTGAMWWSADTIRNIAARKGRDVAL